MYFEISIHTFKILDMKKRIRNHTNPLNFRQHLTDIDFNQMVDGFSKLNLDIGW